MNSVNSNTFHNALKKYLRWLHTFQIAIYLTEFFSLCDTSRTGLLGRNNRDTTRSFVGGRVWRENLQNKRHILWLNLDRSNEMSASAGRPVVFIVTLECHLQQRACSSPSTIFRPAYYYFTKPSIKKKERKKLLNSNTYKIKIYRYRHTGVYFSPLWRMTWA